MLGEQRALERVIKLFPYFFASPHSHVPWQQRIVLFCILCLTSFMHSSNFTLLKQKHNKNMWNVSLSLLSLSRSKFSTFPVAIRRSWLWCKSKFLHRCTNDTWVQLVECGGWDGKRNIRKKFNGENYEYSLYFYIEFSYTYFCDTNVGRFLKALWNVQGRNSSQVLGVNKMKMKMARKRKSQTRHKIWHFLFEI